ncbi:Metallo-dependent phosphatase [Stereum hirsutum FP-91666 SS1]|uniref:Metallo-dependent phosphatase n=1 Tax=Stereum hirsutum (strain FP-91666) TaxID=721885 RepID=UPI000440A331|nr:Metallo-dependent phosphatase [Stereum hirsutum FP-91666 SS1]EIM88622.1 Metallo-dependent phosphatase [Stereum hirsutum FP-91666 SS1]
MTEELPELNIPNPTLIGENPPPTITTPTAIIHSSYDRVDNVPPKPSTGVWTRFVCISDTHEHTFEVPHGDVLLHSGDLTQTGRFVGAKQTADWLCSLSHPIKIVIAGNHDLTLHRDWYPKNFDRWHRDQEPVDEIHSLFVGKEAKKAGLVYLEDESHEFQVHEGGRKWSVYGSPWSPWFYDWAFNYHPGRSAEDLVSKFPKTDILLTHGPPFGILDETSDGSEVGCEALRSRLAHLQPRLHLFGHIHEAHGVEVGEWSKSTSTTDDDSKEVKQTVFVNGANWPAGHRATAMYYRGTPIPFAGPGFQPAIVDLLEV